MWTYNYNFSDELYHHGVLGMKWGVRHAPKETGHIAKGNQAVRTLKGAKTRMKKAKKSGDADAYSKAKTSYKQIKKSTAKDRKRSYDDWDKAIDQGYYGKGGAKRIEKRIDSGMTRRAARGREYARATLIGSIGSLAVLDIMSGGEVHREIGKAAGKAAKSAKVARAAEKARRAVPKLAAYNKPLVYAKEFKILD